MLKPNLERGVKPFSGYHWHLAQVSLHLCIRLVVISINSIRKQTIISLLQRLPTTERKDRKKVMQLPWRVVSAIKTQSPMSSSKLARLTYIKRDHEVSGERWWYLWKKESFARSDAVQAPLGCKWQPGSATGFRRNTFLFSAISCILECPVVVLRVVDPN